MNVSEMALTLYRVIRVGRTLTELKSLKLRRCITVCDRCIGIRIKQLSNFQTIDFKQNFEDKSKKIHLNLIKTFIICRCKML